MSAIDQLLRIREVVATLPRSHPTEGQVAGFGPSPGQKILNNVVRNLDLAIDALKRGTDGDGRSISKARIGDGLKEMASEGLKPRARGRLLLILDDKGVEMFSRCMRDLDDFARRLTSSVA